MSEIPIITTVKELRSLVGSFNHESLGFVPTMGYLHEGHLSLVNESIKDNKHTIISIFVNPSQFSPNEDLDTYPRDINHDIEIIKKLAIGKVDAIFKPSVEEMYPSGFTFDINNQKGSFVEVLGVSKPLEGLKRPTFFKGVATVVTKLFNIVMPTNAYFGQKDIQQTIVIKNLVKDLFLNINIKIVPTIRNENGLALSSRNKYLSNDILNEVTCLYKSMKLSNDSYLNGEFNVEKLTETVSNYITNINDKFKIDYISFNDPKDLSYLTNIDPKIGCILSMAVYVPNSNNEINNETTRLIDNMIFKPL